MYTLGIHQFASIHQRVQERAFGKQLPIAAGGMTPLAVTGLTEELVVAGRGPLSQAV